MNQIISYLKIIKYISFKMENNDSFDDKKYSSFGKDKTPMDDSMTYGN